MPTQLPIAALLALLGLKSTAAAPIPLGFFAALTLTDTALVIALMLIFLRASRERPRDVFFGTRSIAREAAIGLASVPFVLFGVGAIIAGVRLLMPSLHNVAVNPFETFFHSRWQAGVFLILAIIVGGVREELQRGFFIHRFGQALGGQWLGLLIFTAVFGAGHYTQGYDAAIGIGVLGFFWGYLYMKRQSVAAAMASHAGFNSLQVILQTMIRTLPV